MALTKTLTKKSADKNTNNTIVITVNLVLMEDEVEVLNQNFSQNHNPVNNISVARNELVIKIQTAIDKYKSDKVIYDSTAFTDAITYIDNNLEV